MNGKSRASAVVVLCAALCPGSIGLAATLSGRVYEGNVGEERNPLARVTVTLYGSNNSGQKGTYITSTTTDSAGWYGLEVEGAFDYYNIVETNPEKYTSVGATTVGGAVIDNDWIQYDYLALQGTTTGNKFWDKKEGPPVNNPPVANAGPDQAVDAGNVVQLNGSGSSDADGDPLTYSWSLIERPPGSSAVLDNPTAVGPKFTADQGGTYVGQLVVNDGKVDSSPDTVAVSATSEPSRTGEIKGHKFNDENGDGIWNGAETGMAGWTIFADMDPYNAHMDPGEPSDVTGPDGSYSLSGLAPGVYNVYEAAQSGWQITYPSSGFYGITIQGNDLWDGRDFGNHREGGELQEACCLPDGSCASLTPEQCRERGGMPQGPGTVCLGDANGDGVDDICGGQPGGRDYLFDICLNAEIDIPGIGLVRTTLTGPARIQIQVGPNGQALDLNGNGRDEAPAELVDLDLAGMDPLVGAVRLRLNPYKSSIGQVEDWANNTPGVLDVEPFTATGSVDSFFDVFFEVELPDLGLTLCTCDAKRLSGVIESLVPGAASYSEQSSGTAISLYREVAGADVCQIVPRPSPSAFLNRLASCDQLPPVQGRYDYGDAPGPYPTTLAQNGARHTSGGPWLGMAPPDAEQDGQPESSALGDDQQGTDDEDGMGFMTAVVPGQFTWVDITFSGPGQDLTFAVWVDWNQNGQWEDPAERYTSGNMKSLPALPLGIVVANPVPVSAKTGTTFARVRVYKGLNAAISPTGDGGPGEVEDFQVRVQATGQILPPGHMIMGIKFNDLDGDGTWEPLDGEGRLSNWTIWLDTDNDGTPDKTTQTDSQGGFEFAGLSPGTYTIAEQQQAGWTQTAPSGPGTFTVTAPGGLQPTISFAMFGNRRTGGTGWRADWGDAPSPYPTRQVDSGMTLSVSSTLFLGGPPDGESDGQPDAHALGDDNHGTDDEDGVTFTSPLIPGQMATVNVDLTGASQADNLLSASIDFNGDGKWDLSEHFYYAKVPVGAVTTLTFSVPAGAKVGTTFARFYVIDGGPIPPWGLPYGEVEDYEIYIGQGGPYPPTADRIDFGDAPDSYKTLRASGGAYHKAGPLTLGTSVDIETDGQPGPDATGDDLADKDDEDGLVSSLNLTTGKIATVSLTVANGDAAGDSGMVAGWIDFDGSGQFDLVSDDIGTQYVTVPGGGQSTVQFTFLVPAGSKAGKTYARFRLYRDDPNPLAIPWAILPTGPADYGEVEDYVATIRSGISPTDRDYGDAPSPYPVADHALGGPYLGPFGDLPDGDPGMQRNATASGDDNDADGDDENGLLSINLVKKSGVISHAEMKMWIGSTGSLTGAIWIDWNADGDWDDTGELQGSAGISYTKVPPGGGWLHVTWGFPVPATAKPANTFVRLRVYEGSQVAISPSGPGTAGEVEDHLVQIKTDGPGLPPGGIVHGYKWDDRDGDGVWDISEPGLAGWTIWLDLNGSGIDDTGDRHETTDNQGHFRFTGVPAGTYVVGEQPQAGWTQTCPSAPGTYTETVTPGSASFPLVFGNTTRPVLPPDTLKTLDWGDAPDPAYPTLRSSNGAYHVILSGFQLGGAVDPELDGQPSPDALGDDHFGADDEDGVVFLMPILPGGTTGLEIAASAAGVVDAWIDFDGDGAWSQPGDRILTSQPVSTGANVVSVAIPASARLNIATFARFRLSRTGGLSPEGPGQDGEVEDYHILIGPDGPGVPGEGRRPHVKWSQPPLEIDPNIDHPPVFCGWNQSSKSTVLADGRRVWNMAADDFHCLGPIPVTHLRWWGFYKGWEKPELPAIQPLRWRVTFWINRPEMADADPFPEKMVWRLDVPVERVQIEPVGLSNFPESFSEMCFRYDLVLEPGEWFRQAEFPSEQDIYWISIAAVYDEGTENRNLWGWATRSELWRNPGQIIVLYGDGPDANTQLWPGMLLPVTNNELCSRERGYDLAFELLTEPPWIKWDQPFAGIREWPHYADVESQGASIRGQENIGRLVADDWLCEHNTPVIAAAWWGSYIGYGHEACQCESLLGPPRPDYFLLTISTNVGPSRETPYNRPGEVVWQYRAYDYDEVLVGYDKEPEGEPNEPVFRYSVRLPEENWFRQEVPGTLYWFSVTAVYTDPLPRIVHPWGWTSHRHMFESAGLFIDYRLITAPQWQPLRDPADQPIDMSFTLFTGPE